MQYIFAIRNNEKIIFFAFFTCIFLHQTIWKMVVVFNQRQQVMSNIYVYVNYKCNKIK